MADFKTMNLVWTAIHSDNSATDGDFNPTTGYMGATDVDVVQVAFEVANTTDANGIIKLGFQTANVENAPDAATVIASINTQTGNGFSYPTNVFDISDSTKGKQLVRFGFWFSTSSAGLKAARVQGRIKIKVN